MRKQCRPGQSKPLPTPAGTPPGSTPKQIQAKPGRFSQAISSALQAGDGPAVERQDEIVEMYLRSRTCRPAAEIIVNTLNDKQRESRSRITPKPSDLPPLLL